MQGKAVKVTAHGLHVASHQCSISEEAYALPPCAMNSCCSNRAHGVSEVM